MRNRHLLIFDLCLLPLALVCAAALRFEGLDWPDDSVRVLTAYAILALPAKVAIILGTGLHRRLWRYASMADLELLALCAALCAAAGVAIGLGVVPLLPWAGGRMPYSIVALDAVFAGLALTGTRLLVRAAGRPRRNGSSNARRALVVGAGAAGGMIVRELSENPRLQLRPVGLVDDDPLKGGRQLHGVPVVGTLAELPQIVRNLSVDEVIIAMPSAPGEVVRRVVRSIADAGVPTRTVPGIYEILEGRKSVSALRKVEIDDLLRREPVQTDLKRVRTLAAGKTVLVTGAGGSIGSELCRQIARLEPNLLVAVGRGENSVFELLQSLHKVAPGLTVVPVIADVRDTARMDAVFARYRPDTVFHAAAHKHVPLMEANVGEAILNNVLGTRVVVELAHRYGTERFVLISSDKAVRPSSVMGATKRLAEGVVQSYAARSGRPFVSVRFGNVLGSRGSVIPTFLRQIEAGGPLTITHPDMKRYFMTIPEAVQLVLQAGAMGAGRDVFVLDMGEAVRVLDLARDLVRLSGLEEGRDVEIRFTGMRPGEKLYEELFFDAEHAAPTAHPKVLRARNAELPLDGSLTLDALIEMAYRGARSEELRVAIKRLVPEYTGVDVDAGQGAPAPSSTWRPDADAPEADADDAVQPAMTLAPSAP